MIILKKIDRVITALHCTHRKHPIILLLFKQHPNIVITMTFDGLVPIGARSSAVIANLNMFSGQISQHFVLPYHISKVSYHSHGNVFIFVKIRVFTNCIQKLYLSELITIIWNSSAAFVSFIPLQLCPKVFSISVVKLSLVVYHIVPLWLIESTQLLVDKNTEEYWVLQQYS